MSEFDQAIDATGLNCPLPILRCKKAMKGLASGQVLKIVATDGSAPKDFEAYCKQTGDELLSSKESSNQFVFLVKKK